LKIVFFALAALFGRQVARHLDGLVDVAPLVEETPLLRGIKPHDFQGRAESLGPIVNNQFQAVLAADALGFQDLKEGDPFFRAFAGPELPRQDLAAVLVGPYPQGDHDGHLEASFDGP
jgi:hypothetical protein